MITRQKQTADGATSLGFPLAIDASGRISASGGDAALRSKIIQLLFTAPGERVNMPDFGCGLRNLVFEPNNPVLAAAMEFSIGQALARWLGDEISVDGIEVSHVDATIIVEIAYTRPDTRTPQALRLHYG